MEKYLELPVGIIDYVREHSDFAAAGSVKEEFTQREVLRSIKKEKIK